MEMHDTLCNHTHTLFWLQTSMSVKELMTVNSSVRTQKAPIPAAVVKDSLLLMMAGTALVYTCIYGSYVVFFLGAVHDIVATYDVYILFS